MQEGVDRHLVGGVQHAAGSPAGVQRLVGQAEGRELVRVRVFKGQLGKGGEVREGNAAVHPLRVGHRVEDGHPHVRHAQLGQDGPVLKAHHGMDDALGMDDHLDLLRGHVKQPFRLDDFQGLVEHGRRVHGDLLAHVPGRVVQCLGLGGVHDFFLRPGAEGAAGGRQEDAGGLLPLPPLQALEDGAVLAVHRQQGRDPVFHRALLHHQLAAGHQGFLVGQEDPLASPAGGHRHLQPGDADDGHHHVVRPALGRHARQLLRAVKLAKAQVLRHVPQGGAAQAGAQRAEGPDLLKKQPAVRMGGQGDYPEFLRVTPHLVQRLGADGTGGTENRDLFHWKITPRCRKCSRRTRRRWRRTRCPAGPSCRRGRGKRC